MGETERKRRSTVQCSDDDGLSEEHSRSSALFVPTFSPSAVLFFMLLPSTGTEGSALSSRTVPATLPLRELHHLRPRIATSQPHLQDSTSSAASAPHLSVEQRAAFRVPRLSTTRPCDLCPPAALLRSKRWTSPSSERGWRGGISFPSPRLDRVNARDEGSDGGTSRLSLALQPPHTVAGKAAFSSSLRPASTSFATSRPPPPHPPPLPPYDENQQWWADTKHPSLTSDHLLLNTSDQRRPHLPFAACLPPSPHSFLSSAIGAALRKRVRSLVLATASTPCAFAGRVEREK